MRRTPVPEAALSRITPPIAISWWPTVRSPEASRGCRRARVRRECPPNPAIPEARPAPALLRDPLAVRRFPRDSVHTGPHRCGWRAGGGLEAFPSGWAGKRRDRILPEAERQKRCAGRPSQSRLASAGNEFSTAQRNESLASEPAAERQQTQAVFPLQQCHCSSELDPGGRAISGTSRQQAEMQPRHGEYRIEVNRYPIMFCVRSAVTPAFHAQCEQIMGTRAHFVDAQQLIAGRFGALELSGVRQQRCA